MTSRSGSLFRHLVVNGVSTPRQAKDPDKPYPSKYKTRPDRQHRMNLFYPKFHHGIERPVIVSPQVDPSRQMPRHQPIVKIFEAFHFARHSETRNQEKRHL